MGTRATDKAVAWNYPERSNLRTRLFSGRRHSYLRPSWQQLKLLKCEQVQRDSTLSVTLFP